MVAQIKNGYRQIVLESWDDFYEVVNKDPFEKDDYIFRGQRDSTWALVPTLYRLMGHSPYRHVPETREAHWQTFKSAAVGRRRPNPPELSENQWWALGQHYGLATPFLDWTYSPFVGAFFAFSEMEHLASLTSDECHSAKPKWRSRMVPESFRDREAFQRYPRAMERSEKSTSTYHYI